MNLYDIAIARALSSGGGGGGSSDFTTATVTVTNNVDDFLFALAGAFPIDEGGMGVFESTWGINSGNIETKTVGMYKNGIILENVKSIYNIDDPPTYVSTTTGDVTVMEEGMYWVTGDCTITIS